MLKAGFDVPSERTFPSFSPAFALTHHVLGYMVARRTKSTAMTASSSTSSNPNIVIRRPAHPKPHARAHISASEDLDAPSTVQSSRVFATPSAQAGSSATTSDAGHPMDRDRPAPSDELIRIRQLLRPPEIVATADWGIPPASTEPCDPAIEVCLFSIVSVP